jgi:hypothetical protein
VLVLELRPPELPTFEALLLLWPTWLSYAVSYLFIAIVWTNHHYLMRYATEATPRLLWFNFAHLFSMSLLPLSTAWMVALKYPLADRHLRLLLIVYLRPDPPGAAAGQPPARYFDYLLPESTGIRALLCRGDRLAGGRPYLAAAASAEELIAAIGLARTPTRPASRASRASPFQDLFASVALVTSRVPCRARRRPR